MLKLGRTYLDLNERSILQLDDRLTPGAKRAATHMFAGPGKDGETWVNETIAEDTALKEMCDVVDRLAGGDHQKAWEVLNSLRILYEFRHNLPSWALSKEPALQKKK